MAVLSRGHGPTPVCVCVFVFGKVIHPRWVLPGRTMAPGMFYHPPFLFPPPDTCLSAQVLGPLNMDSC